LDLAEAVAPSADSCQLDGKNKVRVTGAVEEWYEALLVRKALVDEEIFLIVAHRVAEINSLHLPVLRSNSWMTTQRKSCSLTA